MNKLVQDLIVEYNAHPQFIRNLNQSQLRWTQYRNTMIKVYMDLDEKPRDYTEEQKNCKCGKAAELTVKRIKELEVFQKEVATDLLCL